MTQSLLLELAPRPGHRVRGNNRRRPPRRSRPEAPEPATGGVVLLVDPSESSRRASERALERAGYTVHSFASADALLDAMSRPGRGSSGGLAFLRLDEIERRAIEAAVTRTHGNITRAMKLLGIGRTTLYRKLKHYGLR
jgi:DNA-binding NtrC family response regulator